MAATIHMKITKSDGKAIEGETSQIGDAFFKGMIECTYFEQTVSIPFEAGTNVQAVSNRSHSPVQIRKRWDSSTPLLREAMKQTENLTIEFFFHRPGRKKTGDHRFFGITLTDAKIASSKMYSPDAYLNKAHDSLVPVEEILFTFQSIKLSHFNEENNAAIEGHDDHQKAWQQK